MSDGPKNGRGDAGRGTLLQVSDGGFTQWFHQLLASPGDIIIYGEELTSRGFYWVAHQASGGGTVGNRRVRLKSHNNIRRGGRGGWEGGYGVLEG